MQFPWNIQLKTVVKKQSAKFSPLLSNTSSIFGKGCGRQLIARKMHLRKEPPYYGVPHPQLCVQSSICYFSIVICPFLKLKYQSAKKCIITNKSLKQTSKLSNSLRLSADLKEVHVMTANTGPKLWIWCQRWVAFALSSLVMSCPGEELLRRCVGRCCVGGIELAVTNCDVSKIWKDAFRKDFQAESSPHPQINAAQHSSHHSYVWCRVNSWPCPQLIFQKAAVVQEPHNGRKCKGENILAFHENLLQAAQLIGITKRFFPSCFKRSNLKKNNVHSNIGRHSAVKTIMTEVVNVS